MCGLLFTEFSALCRINTRIFVIFGVPYTLAVLCCYNLIHIPRTDAYCVFRLGVILAAFISVFILLIFIAGLPSAVTLSISGAAAWCLFHNLSVAEIENVAQNIV